MFSIILIGLLIYLVYLYLYISKIIWEYLDQLIKGDLLVEDKEEAKVLSQSKSLFMPELRKAWCIIRHYEKSPK